MKFRPELNPEHFKHKGCLEEVMSDSSAMRTVTESIADSNIYNELASDMSGFAKMYEKERRRLQEKEELEREADPSKAKMTPAQLTAFKEKIAAAR